LACRYVSYDNASSIVRRSPGYGRDEMTKEA
jgi:hypothetical protein